jgi:hypothetical protein
LPIDLEPSAILALCLGSTFYMTGVIWFVQLVHYPAYHFVGSAEFIGYQSRHVVATTVCVFPPMLCELATSVWLAFVPPPELPAGWFAVGLALVIGNWLSTFLVQVPCHQRLERGYDQRTVNWLVSSNWLRVIMWTARAIGGGLLVAGHGFRLSSGG